MMWLNDKPLHGEDEEIEALDDNIRAYQKQINAWTARRQELWHAKFLREMAAAGPEGALLGLDIETTAWYTRAPQQLGGYQFDQAVLQNALGGLAGATIPYRTQDDLMALQQQHAALQRHVMEHQRVMMTPRTFVGPQVVTPPAPGYHDAYATITAQVGALGQRRRERLGEQRPVEMGPRKGFLAGMREIARRLTGGGEPGTGE